MKNWIIKNKTILFFVLLLLGVSFDAQITILLFVIVFQIIAFLGVTSQIRKYIKVKKSPVTSGVIIDVRKISSVEESTNNYECNVEFVVPSTKNKYVIKHQLSSFESPHIGNKLEIWINEQNPQASVVTKEYSLFWFYSIALLGLVSIGLLWVDFFLIKQIFKHYKIDFFG